MTVTKKDESVQLAHTVQGMQQLIMVNFSYNSTLLPDCVKEIPILNTRTYTKKWHSPDGTTHNETDYICISSNWRSSIQDVRVFRGADCGSDWVGGKSCIKFKKMAKDPPTKRFDIGNLKDDSVAQNFRTKLSLKDSENFENKWVNFKTVVLKAAETVIGFRRGWGREMWISAAA